MPGTSVLGILTNRLKLWAASSIRPCGAVAPIWHTEQIGVNTLAWMALKLADSGTGPPELDPDSGWPLLSRPAPLPEQAHSQAQNRATPANRLQRRAIGRVAA